MKIAICSQNWQTVTNHPGKTGRFRVFQAEPGLPPMELARLELSPDLIFRHVQGGGHHPLYDMDAVIAGSAGAGFVNRLDSHGVKVAVTSEKDPLAAIAALLDGTLVPCVATEASCC